MTSLPPPPGQPQWGPPPGQQWGPPGGPPGQQWGPSPAAKKSPPKALLACAACGIGFVLLAGLGALVGGGEDSVEETADEVEPQTDEADEPDGQVEEPEAAEPEPPAETQPPTTPAPGWADGAPITEEAVIAQLGDSPRKLQGADVVALSEPEKVVVDVATGNVTLWYFVESAWDEDAMVRHASHISYSASRSMFVNPAVQSVVVHVETDFTDLGGNTESAAVTTSTLSRATIDTVPINWDGLGDRLEYDDESWFCVIDGATIHPSMAANDALDDDSCVWVTDTVYLF